MAIDLSTSTASIAAMDLRQYLEHTGLSQARLADILNEDGDQSVPKLPTVTQGAISQWLVKDRIPPARVPQLVRISGGLMTAHELRPDLWRDSAA